MRNWHLPAWYWITMCVPLLWLAGAGVSAAEYESQAPSAILLDLQTNQVLYEKNADQPRPPASMSKLMTVYMMLELMKDGTLLPEDTFPVSEKAWRKGGSKMFVEVGKRVRVDDLLRGIIVLSGNDACIVVAEGLAGSEEAFAAQMTAKARELGLFNSHFVNASGWPQPNHVMSVRDLALLSQRLVEEFPEYYSLFGETTFEYSGIRQPNRNLLLGHVRGADGLKTGYSEEAGFGMVASAMRDGRRLISVVAGLQTAAARAQESERLLEYGFRNFANYRLVAAGQEIDHATVWQGEHPVVPLVVGQGLTVTMTKEARQALQIKLVYDAPLPAPVRKGDEVATLEIGGPGFETRVIPVLAGEDVQKAGLIGRMTSALEYLIFGPS